MALNEVAEKPAKISIDTIPTTENRCRVLYIVETPYGIKLSQLRISVGNRVVLHKVFNTQPRYFASSVEVQKAETVTIVVNTTDEQTVTETFTA